ncbi:TPA: hypothetical protein ACS3G7_002787 [Legionella pneumophila]
MELFTNESRSETRGAYEGEHPFTYLQISSRKEAQDVREFLNKCWSNYPDSEKRDMLKRIMNPKITHCNAALFELIIHQLLIELNYKVKVHPDVPNSTKKPDFLVKDIKDNKFYLEAIVASENDDYQRSLETEKNALFRDIENEFSRLDGYNLWISVITQTQKSLIRKSLFKDINFKITNFENNLKWIFTDISSGWEIELQLWKTNRKGGRFISVIYPQFAQIVAPAEAIRKAIKKKASRYNELEYPFVIAINVISSTLDSIDEMNALFGDEVVHDYIDGPEIHTRLPNGAILGPRGPKNRRVSGIWIFDNLNPWALHKNHTLYLNSEATISISEKFYSILPHKYIEDNKLKSTSGVSIFELLKLKWEWVIKYQISKATNQGEGRL